MGSLLLRAPRDADWPEILALANASVAGVPAAGVQDEWAERRRRFDHTRGTQRQIVALDESSRAIVGYGAFESCSGAPGAFRLFLVTAPEQLGRIGEILYQNLVGLLRGLDAREARFQEYAGDALLLEFARTRGFVERERFALPGGGEAVLLCRVLDRGA